MSKRKKTVIIVLIVLAALYFLLIGASYIFLKTYVYPAFTDCTVVGEYPYSNAAAPEDFAEYSMQGIKLNAPEGLEAKINDSVCSRYLSNDPAQYDLQITVMNQEAQDSVSLSEMLDWMKEEHPLLGNLLDIRGGLTKLGMKQIGYKIPENNNELMYLLEKMDWKDYNKFSLTEVYAFTKLYVLKAVFVPALMRVDAHDADNVPETPIEIKKSTYSLEADAFKAIIVEDSSESGRYWLTVRYYPDSAAEKAKVISVLSADPALAQAVAASVRPA